MQTLTKVWSAVCRLPHLLSICSGDRNIAARAELLIAETSVWTLDDIPRSVTINGDVRSPVAVVIARRGFIRRQAPFGNRNQTIRASQDIISDFGEGKSSWTLALLSFRQGADKTREHLRQLRGRGINERSFWVIFRYKKDLQPPLMDGEIKYISRFFATAIIGETPGAFELSTLPLTTLREMGK